MARSRSINYITTDLKYDRSNRAPAFGAFPSARRLANATWTGLKMEIETEGTTSKFQRQLVSRETLGNFCVSSRSKRSLSLSYARKRCFENCLSIYGLLRVQRHSLYFFFLFLSHVYYFFFLFSQALSLTLSPSFSLYSSRSSHIARTATGVVSFFFFFFYLRNIVWHHVRVSSVFLYYKIKRFVCHLVTCQHLFSWGNQKTVIRRFVSYSEKYAKLAVLGNISAVKK